MRRLVTVLLLLVLSASLAVSLAWAQKIRIEPIPPHVKPQWTPVPGVPGVYYAPNLPTDVFRYQGRYYLFWAGFMYRSRHAKGPYQGVKQMPDVFSKIDPPYFKTAKGREGAPAPGGSPAGPGIPPVPPAPGAGVTPPPAPPEVPAAPEVPTPPPAGPEGTPTPPKVM